MRSLQSGTRLLGLLKPHGPVAQSGERRPRMAEVTSSSLVGSTLFSSRLQVKREEQEKARRAREGAGMLLGFGAATGRNHR